MTPHDLIAAFDALAEAPEGVSRLRELVLQLAVRGKLVRQDRDDEPASALLGRVAAERSRLVREGKIRKSKLLLPVRAETVPFEVPQGWAWARLGAVATVLVDGSHNPPRDAGPDGIPMLSGQNVRNGSITLCASRHVSESDFETETRRYDVREGDVLVCIVGSIGRAAVVPRGFPRVALQRSAALVRVPEMCPAFLAAVLQSPTGQEYLLGNAKGTAQLGVYLGTLASMPLPIPPLAEQNRIVARVDELMGLLDRLDAARSTRDGTRTDLRDTALAALLQANSHDEVDAAWQRIAERMDDLFTDRVDVDPLRQAVLHLAVRGRLVPQDPDDEPAGLLLERIAAEKARQVREGKIPKATAAPAVSKVELPFMLPQGWVWCQIDDVFYVSGGIQKSSKRKPVRNIFPYLRVANVQRGRLDLSEIAEFELFEGELDRLRLEPGDLLVVEGNGSESEIGRCARWAGEIHDCVHQNHLIRCRPVVGGHEHFVLRFLNSPAGMDMMKSLAVTTSGLFNLSVGRIRSIPIPLPPLAEQHRIVARVDELMGLLDRLEQHLVATRDAHDAFAAAAVHHLDA